MQIKILLFSVLCLLTVAACHKHDHDDDSEAPVLNIEKPTEGSSIAGEVHIHGTVTDNILHEMAITVTRDSDGTQLFKATPKVHNKTEYSFDEHFTPIVSEETAVTLTITVVDHSSNKTVKTVKFSVKP